MIEAVLNANPDLREHLFVRGFMMTDSSKSFDLDSFPFFDNWITANRGRFQFFVHRAQKMTFVERGDHVFFLLGHAYNPITMEHEEEAVLSRIADALPAGEAAYYDAVDEITGLFVLGYASPEGLTFIIDPNGLQSGVYGVIDGDFYLSSHAQLLGDLCGLTMDPFVRRLVGYKWYNRVMGPYLPADLSPFAEVKRIVPNMEYTYSNGSVGHERFYPREVLETCRTDAEYQQLIEQAAEILRGNLALIARKWDHPHISLTGGSDSNTTFAAANGNYDHFEAFSYVSAEKEIQDAAAAGRIADAFEVKHTRYDVPDSNDDLPGFDDVAAIIKHNNAYILNEKDNELRKRVVLMRECPADVEVKSWGSETIRAYWYKHYGRSTMPKLSAKLFRNLYKIFVADRKLAAEIDALFEEYIRDFDYAEASKSVPPADLHYWEVTWGSWGGMNISEMKICFEVTIPYNNRRFLDLLFRVPLGKRISDQHHLDMKEYLNEDLSQMNIRVINLHETRLRAALLNAIFATNMAMPI